MNPLLTVNQASYLLNQEKSQRGVTVGINNADATTVFSNKSEMHDKHNQGLSKKNNFNMNTAITVDTRRKIATSWFGILQATNSATRKKISTKQIRRRVLLIRLLHYLELILHLPP